MRNTQSEQTILNAIGLLSANFTAAVTDIITSSAHGLKTGDKVVLTTTTTLPAGLSTSTNYYVIKIDANTFYLSTRNTDDVNQRVDITNTGTGTHTFTMSSIGSVINVEEYKHCVLAINTDNSANMTIKIQGSTADTAPNFGAAQSPTNRWEYIQAVDLEDGAVIDGDTGIAFAGTDDNRMVEVNTNHLKWITIAITTFAAGDVSARAKLSDNK